MKETKRRLVQHVHSPGLAQTTTAAVLVLMISACNAGQPEPELTPGEQGSASQSLINLDFGVKLVKEQRYTIPLHFQNVAKDDGSYSQVGTLAQAEAAMEPLNGILFRNGSNIRFYVSPSSDFYNPHKNTYISSACDPVASWQSSPANADPDDVCVPHNLSDVERQEKKDIHQVYVAHVRSHHRSLPVFMRTGYNSVSYDANNKKWVMDYFSGVGPKNSAAYIGKPPKNGDLMHELGHVLGLAHPFTSNGKAAWTTLAEVEDAIRAKMASDSSLSPHDALTLVFDGDKLADTPPDSAGTLFNTVYGPDTYCHHSTLPFTMFFDPPWNQQFLALAPDVSNVMSYFKWCRDAAYLNLSPLQNAVMSGMVVGDMADIAKPIEQWVWKNELVRSIPSYPLEGVQSPMFVASGPVHATEVWVAVDIQSVTGGFDITLHEPSGTGFLGASGKKLLQKAADNAVSNDDRRFGHIKRLFRVTLPGMVDISGAWMLEVRSGITTLQSESRELVTWSLEPVAPCASGSEVEHLGGNIYGCSGHVTFANRSSLCGSGCSIARANQYIAREACHSGAAPTHNYWTDDELKYNGVGSDCYVSLTTGHSCPAGQPMRVCGSSLDAEGNGCAWTNCSMNADGAPNDYFGGCSGTSNAYAGAVCKCDEPVTGPEIVVANPLCAYSGCSAAAAGTQSMSYAISGCAGHVPFADRASLCTTGWHVCSANEWLTLGNVVPVHNYWTNDDLKYTGSGSNQCAVASTGGSCGTSPMRVCKPAQPDVVTVGGSTVTNSCNWTGCGYLTNSPNEYFGGCAGNTYAGTLCCRD